MINVKPGEVFYPVSEVGYKDNAGVTHRVRSSSFDMVGTACDGTIFVRENEEREWSDEKVNCLRCLARECGYSVVMGG